MPLADDRAAVYERCRPQLIAYATRMVGQRAVAEDLAQEAALRLLSDQMADAQDESHIRAWLFKVVTRLALDHLRRHSTWREVSLPAIRDRAEQDVDFVKASLDMRGSPEMAAIAREHLAVCFSCTLRNLSPRQAACLLLKEVYGLTVEETAAAVDATFGQAKNWLQEGRAELERRYQQTCALIAKTGVCYQCVELDDFFNGERRDPLAGTKGDVAARLQLLRGTPDATPGPWHDRMLALVADILE